VKAGFLRKMSCAIMFEGAEIKLQDARMAIQRLRALVKPPRTTNIQIRSGPSGVSGELVGIDDPVAFSEAFSSCVTQVRSVGDALLLTKWDKEKIEERETMWPGFKKWREERIRECRSDDLMKFIEKWRNADLHAGDCPLSFVMYPHNKLEIAGVDAALPRGATLCANATGIYWIFSDTPDERHPYVIQDGCVFTVAIIDPPTMHKGKPLTSTDPDTVCATAEKYYTDLLREARRLFR